MEFVPIATKGISGGMRMGGFQPLSPEEIAYIIKEIHRIEADESLFIFNDPEYKKTCYVPLKDKIFIARNVFPDLEYASTHPRDKMSVACVLAYEYYGHRMFRQEYLNDYNNNTITTPKWKDEVRASINAAKIAPGLTRLEQSYLVDNAIVRAEEFGQRIKNDAFMKEILYGYPRDDKHIAGKFGEPILFVSDASKNGNAR